MSLDISWACHDLILAEKKYFCKYASVFWWVLFCPDRNLASVNTERSDSLTLIADVQLQKLHKVKWSFLIGSQLSSYYFFYYSKAVQADGEKNETKSKNPSFSKDTSFRKDDLISVCLVWKTEMAGLARCWVSDPSISIVTAQTEMPEASSSYLSGLWGSWVDTFVVLGKICLSKRQISVTAHKNIYDPELKTKSIPFGNDCPEGAGLL